MQQTGRPQFQTYWKFYFLLFFALLYALTATAQSKYTINGYGKQFRNGDVLYLNYKIDDKSVLDSVKVHNKKFAFSGIADKPVKASLYRNENPMKADVVKEVLKLYLEPGIIKINCPDILTNASLGGTPLNETMELYRLKLAPLTEKSKTLKDSYWFTEAEKKDTALVNSTHRKHLQLSHERTLLELEFIKEHPSSNVSLEMLEKISRQSKFIDGVEIAYKELDKQLKTTPQGIIIKENIVKARMVKTGQPAKDFVLPDSNGKEVRLSSFKGNYMLLDFWASWCGPCREEHPNLIAAYEKYKEKGFTILSVSIDVNKEKWLSAIAKDKLTWTQVSDLKANKSESYQLYGITTIPANFLIDPKGTIIAKDLKGELLDKELEKIFRDK